MRRAGWFVGTLWVLFPAFCVTPVPEGDLFEQAVECIKGHERWHSARHYPYVGYGHRLLPGERFTADISEAFADSLLRADLRRKCAVFREFGKDSLLLGVLAYNVGEYSLLGGYGKPRSRLVRKLEGGNRDIWEEYVSFCFFQGVMLPSLRRRREEEFDLLFFH